MKREDFQQPEYSIFENIWVTDDEGNVFCARWLAFSHSFGTTHCPELLNGNYIISDLETGVLNTRENSINSAIKKMKIAKNLLLEKVSRIDKTIERTF